MRFLLKPNQYSKHMRYCTVTTDKWNRLIASPMVRENKDEAPLSIWGAMTGKVMLDPETMYPRCIAENLLCMYALQIDVDAGQTIDEFVRDYHRYSFQLYTSYSHGFKPNDRFRAIFPLAEPLYVEWLVRPVKDILLSMFDQIDETCCDRCHWQILPCIRAKDAPYRYLQHDGERLSFARDDFAKIAREYKEDSHWKREIAEADRDPRDNHDGAIRWVQNVLNETQEGSRNRTSYSKLMWLKQTVGATYGEVLALRAPAGFEDEFAKMIERIYGR